MITTAVLIIFIFNTFSITTEIINILLLLDFVLIGGILPLLERKKLALIQRRVGPKYVGFNGRLQFIADSIKLLLKDYFYIFRSNKYVYYLIPIIFFYINMLFLYNFQWNNIFIYDIEYNIVYLAILSSISTIMVFLTGFFSRNKYTIISSTRSIYIYFINEILLSVIILHFIYLVHSLSFSDSALNNTNSYGFYLWLPLLPILILVFLLEVGKSPFDFLESESELVMGYTTEYTGFLFGIYILVEYIHMYVYSYFFIIIWF